jgi:hypothetical protein
MKYLQGVARSLWEEACRNGQRACESFFLGQTKVFVIDAGATIEYLAKHTVARADPKNLYDPSIRQNLTTDDLFVLDPHKYCLDSNGHVRIDIDQSAAEVALAHLGELRTISGKVAINLANDPQHLKGAMDAASAHLLREARNRALHIGEFPDDPDLLAKAFLDVVQSMSHRLEPGLFGDWRDVATTSHMTSKRRPIPEMEVRMSFAKASWYRPVSTHRRGRVKLADDQTTEACPFCLKPAAISQLLGTEVPERSLDPSERSSSVTALDCLYCGLELFGEQVAEAIRRRDQRHEYEVAIHNSPPWAGL